MKVLFTPEAREEFERIRELYRLGGAQAADSFVRRVRAGVKMLRRFPLAGHAVPELGDDDLRSLVIDSYRMFYRVIDGKVWILELWDARRASPERVGEVVAAYR